MTPSTTPGFSLRQLSYLVAIADKGSMTAAAETCHTSQAAISVALAGLERKLGAQLLLRQRGRGVAFTEAGMRVVAQARAVLSQVDDLQMAARSADRELVGHLAVGCFTPLAPFLVPPLLDTFHGTYPAIDIHIREGSQTEVCGALLAGECEVTLTYDVDLPADLDSVTLRRLKPYVLLAAGHPLTRKAVIRLEDLEHERLIQCELSPIPHNNEQLMAAAGLRANVHYRTSDIELVRALVARGLGYTMLVQRWPSDVSHEGLPLVTRELGGKLPEYDLVAVWPRKTRLTGRARALLEFLRQDHLIAPRTGSVNEVVTI